MSYIISNDDGKAKTLLVPHRCLECEGGVHRLGVFSVRSAEPSKAAAQRHQQSRSVRRLSHAVSQRI